MLADTAMVGHLGTRAGRAGAGRDVDHGHLHAVQLPHLRHTAQVARLHGAGEEEAAGRIAAQALWVSTGIGVVLLALLAGLAVPLVRLMGGEGRTGELAVTYMRIAALGLPFALIALAGQGYLRGVSDLRTPLLIVVASNAANVVLGLVFIYGFGWGIAGSAWGTVWPRPAWGPRSCGRCWPRRPTRDGRRSTACARCSRSAPRSSFDRPCTRRSGGHRRARPRRLGVAGRAPDRLPALDLPRADARRDRDRGPGDGRPRAGRRRRGAPMPRRAA